MGKPPRGCGEDCLPPPSGVQNKKYGHPAAATAQEKRIVVDFKNLDVEPIFCSICQTNKKMISVDAVWCPNDHSFHNACMYMWMRSSRAGKYRDISCPVCKAGISVSKVSILGGGDTQRPHKKRKKLFV
jgi:hypothetical protein